MGSAASSLLPCGASIDATVERRSGAGAGAGGHALAGEPAEFASITAAQDGGDDGDEDYGGVNSRGLARKESAADVSRAAAPSSLLLLDASGLVSVSAAAAQLSHESLSHHSAPSSSSLSGGRPRPLPSSNAEASTASGSSGSGGGGRGSSGSSGAAATAAATKMSDHEMLVNPAPPAQPHLAKASALQQKVPACPHPLPPSSCLSSFSPSAGMRKLSSNSNSNSNSGIPQVGSAASLSEEDERRRQSSTANGDSLQAPGTFCSTRSSRRNSFESSAVASGMQSLIALMRETSCAQRPRPVPQWDPDVRDSSHDSLRFTPSPPPVMGGSSATLPPVPEGVRSNNSSRRNSSGNKGGAFTAVAEVRRPSLAHVHPIAAHSRSAHRAPCRSPATMDYDLIDDDDDVLDASWMGFAGQRERGGGDEEEASAGDLDHLHNGEGGGELLPCPRLVTLGGPSEFDVSHSAMPRPGSADSGASPGCFSLESGDHVFGTDFPVPRLSPTVLETLPLPISS